MIAKYQGRSLPFALEWLKMPILSVKSSVFGMWQLLRDYDMLSSFFRVCRPSRIHYET